MSCQYSQDPALPRPARIAGQQPASICECRELTWTTSPDGPLADRVSAKPLIALDHRRPENFSKISDIQEFSPFAVRSPPLAFVGNRSIIMGSNMGN
jgi:hypothetical protein